MAGTKQIIAPAGQFGYSGSSNKLFSVGAEMTSAETSTTINAGDSVMFGTTSGQIIKSTTAGAINRFAGVALEAIAPGASGQVCVFGFANANVETVSQFDILIRSASNAGKLDTLGGTSAQGGCAIALTATSSGTADVWVVGPGVPTS